MATNLSLVALIVCFFTLLGCQPQHKEEPTKEPTKPLAQILDEMMAPSPEQIALLSAKYQLKSDSVKSILLDFLHLHDPGYRLLTGSAVPVNATPEPPEAFHNTLDELSKNYGVPSATIAALLVDYRIWHECTERCEGTGAAE